MDTPTTDTTNDQKPADGSTPTDGTSTSSTSTEAAKTDTTTNASAPAAGNAAVVDPATPAAAPAPVAGAAVTDAPSRDVVVEAAKAKVEGFLATLSGHIKAAEEAGEREAHAAMVSLHANLAELKNKLELVGGSVTEEAKHLVERLKSIL